MLSPRLQLGERRFEHHVVALDRQFLGNAKFLQGRGSGDHLDPPTSVLLCFANEEPLAAGWQKHLIFAVACDVVAGDAWAVHPIACGWQSALDSHVAAFPLEWHRSAVVVSWLFTAEPRQLATAVRTSSSPPDARKRNARREASPPPVEPTRRVGIGGALDLFLNRGPVPPADATPFHGRRHSHGGTGFLSCHRPTPAVCASACTAGRPGFVLYRG